MQINGHSNGLKHPTEGQFPRLCVVEEFAPSGEPWNACNHKHLVLQPSKGRVIDENIRNVFIVAKSDAFGLQRGRNIEIMGPKGTVRVVDLITGIFGHFVGRTGHD